MAKIPITLEAGTADGKLAYASNIYNESTDKFVGDELSAITNTISTLTTKAEVESTYATKASLSTVETNIETLTGLNGSNFMGIFSTVDGAKGAYNNKVGWALVGESLSALTAYRVTSLDSAVSVNEKTYNFTDYSEIKTKTEEHSNSITELQNKTSEISGETISDSDESIVISKTDGTEVVHINDSGASVTGALKLNNKDVLTEHQDISGKADAITVYSELNKKQNKLTAGENVSIDSGYTISVNLDNKANVTYVNEELAKKQNALTPGENISINNNIISADTSNKADKVYVNEELAKKQDTLTPGDNVTLSANTISVNLNNKQDKLTAGENIIISGNTISAVGGYDEISEETISDSDETIVISKTDGTEVVHINDSGASVTGTLKLNNKDVATEDDIDDLSKVIITADDDETEIADLDDSYLTRLTNLEIAASNIENKADKTYVDEELIKKQDKLTVGENVTIDSGNTISVNISSKADKTYVDEELAKKQNNLTAGDNITISGNTISASGTGGYSEISEETASDSDESVIISKSDDTEILRINESGITVNNIVTISQSLSVSGLNITEQIINLVRRVTDLESKIS